MLSGKQVEVIVNKAGQVKVEYAGFLGQSCLGASQALKDQLAALGLDIQGEEVTPKPEMYVSGVLNEAENTHSQQTRQAQGQGQ